MLLGLHIIKRAEHNHIYSQQSETIFSQFTDIATVIMEAINSVVQNFVLRAECQSFHIDEIVDAHKISTKEKLFNESIGALKQTIELLVTAKSPTFKVELFIELVGESKELKSSTKEISILIGEIDNFSMPEVFISIPLKEYWQPKIETYTHPLSFDFGANFEKLVAFYYEYRTHEEMTENDVFNRWIVFSYIED